MRDVRVGSECRDHLQLDRIGAVNRSLMTDPHRHGAVCGGELDAHLPVVLDDPVKDRVGRLKLDHGAESCGESRCA